MSFSRPSLDQIHSLANDIGLVISPEEAEAYHGLMNWDAYELIDAMPDFVPEVGYPRMPGYRPPEAENRLGAWYYKCEVKGRSEGKLPGRTVVLKDNIALAGVPMMTGARHLEGFVPSIDATVATRILDAGATIVGKAACEHLCCSGGSHTSDLGPVHNPLKHGHSAGGSSSGSAALVAAREVDMAIGTDTGGSIRIPAAYCGIYGMKPTHGLVPCTGIMPMESTIDHAGPMTATVADNALLLEVIAGEDGLDPQQYAPKVSSYTDVLGRGAEGIRIALVSEGFSVSGMQPQIAGKVRAGAARLEGLGASVSEISLPELTLAAAVWQPIFLEGATNQMMLGNASGLNRKGFYDVSLLDAHSTWRARSQELGPTVKLSMLQGAWGLRHYHGRYYAKAQNLRRCIKAAIDALFESYDLLIYPAVPSVATKLPAAGATLAEVMARGFEMVPSTSPIDVTGHPSMSIPCGLVDGLPVGMMLTAANWEEALIYQVADAFEREGDWRTL